MFTIGRWANFQELEDDLSLPELMEAYIALRKREDRHARIQARLFGAKIPIEDEDEPQGDESAIDRVRRTIAERKGTTVDQQEFESMGFGYGVN